MLTSVPCTGLARTEAPVLILLATITVCALITTKERTVTKVSFNDVSPLLQFLTVNMLLIIMQLAASVILNEFLSLF